MRWRLLFCTRKVCPLTSEVKAMSPLAEPHQNRHVEEIVLLLPHPFLAPVLHLLPLFCLCLSSPGELPPLAPSALTKVEVRGWHSLLESPSTGKAWGCYWSSGDLNLLSIPQGPSTGECVCVPGPGRCKIAHSKPGNPPPTPPPHSFPKREALCPRHSQSWGEVAGVEEQGELFRCCLAPGCLMSPSRPWAVPRPQPQLHSQGPRARHPAFSERWDLCVPSYTGGGAEAKNSDSKKSLRNRGVGLGLLHTSLSV